ncbi:unnamed protein product [Ilex paraguariensis]|uniref:Uncharacterized protein n=1 Tax=Ilex paraguariensis TaxID=185542 RepID=A0ABC8U0R0_9AQUA
MAPAGGSSLVPSLPPPRPKPPPECPNLYGKRRELARIQMMEAEIGFLEAVIYAQRSFSVPWRNLKLLKAFNLLPDIVKKLERFVGLTSGNGFVECPASISHGAAAMNACLVFKGHTVASAIQVTTFHVPVVQYPSFSVASGHTPNALTKSLAVEVVAAFNFLHAPIALAVDRSNGAAVAHF